MASLDSPSAVPTVAPYFTTTASRQDSRVSTSSNAVASVSSGDSSNEPISYITSDADQPTEAHSTRQAKDYRSPSTFWKNPWKEMTLHELTCGLATCPAEIHELKEYELDRGPVPSQSIARENWFILRTASVPLLLQTASYYFFPNFKWPASMAYLVYFLSFSSMAIAIIRRLNRYCSILGTFDKKNIGRDRTPDKHVDALAKGIWSYMMLRVLGVFVIGYSSKVSPINAFSWTYPIRLGLWEITLDYFFYVYHRSCHEVDALWFIHQQHHTTKHPTAVLSILAGNYQEVLEIALCPLAASLLIPMSFHELYLTLCYTLYVEMLGHSGIRSYWTHPVLGHILRPFDMDLAIEDHDLHHHFGKSGRN